MIWLFFALMIVGSICAGLLEAHANDEQPDTASDDEFNHHEGDDDYGE